MKSTTHLEYVTTPETIDIVLNSMNSIFDVAKEMLRQDKKWGSDRQQSDLMWNCILGEERGEVERAILERDGDNLRNELIQVAAVALQWVKAYDSRNGTQAGRVMI